MSVGQESQQGSAVRRLARHLSQAWLPQRCLLCDAPGGTGLDLCDVCLAVLPALRRPLHGWLACLACGDAVQEVAAPSHLAVDPLAPVLCERCRARSSPFAQMVAPWRFAAPVDTWVRALKRDRCSPVARVFGTVIARAVTAERARNGVPAPGAGAPILLPVPMHARRLRERGSNHAEAIARWVAHELHMRVHAGWAMRIVDTGSLAERSRAERQLAIRGAFSVHPAVADRHVVLVDDVLTSGATAGELARECHDTGAASVSLWVAARTCMAPLDAPSLSNRDSTAGKVV